MIRPARVDDAAQIALVHVRSWQEAYRGLMPQAYLDALDPARRVDRWARSLAETEPAGRGGVLVAEDGGRVVGFIGYSPSHDDDADQDQVGEVGAIYLRADTWGKGIGRRLMDTALGHLAETGFNEATLWVLGTNVRARRFYEAGGWTADGTAKTDETRGFQIAEVRYRKPLPGPA